MKKIKTIIFVAFCINIPSCGTANYVSTPVRSVSNGIGNTIGAAFIAAKPEQGTYRYPMTQQ